MLPLIFDNPPGYANIMGRPWTSRVDASIIVFGIGIDYSVFFVLVLLKRYGTLNHPAFLDEIRMAVFLSVLNTCSDSGPCGGLTILCSIAPVSTAFLGIGILDDRGVRHSAPGAGTY